MLSEKSADYSGPLEQQEVTYINLVESSHFPPRPNAGLHHGGLAGRPETGVEADTLRLNQHIRGQEEGQGDIAARQSN